MNMDADSDHDGKTTAVSVFISYSHKDEGLVNEFKTFMHPLEDNGTLRMWYDRKIDVGEDWNEEIEKHLNEANIIIFCVSSDFLASNACKGEVEKGYARYERGLAFVLPVVFRVCGWQDVEPFKSRQVLPHDGIAVFSDKRDSYLKEVYDKIKEKAALIAKVRKVKFSDNWTKELNSLGALSSVLTMHANVSLDDIFVYPDVHDISPNLSNPDSYLDAEVAIADFDKHRGLIISGESQSGKTSLIYKYIVRLFEKGYVPIYLDGRNRHNGGWDKRIKKAIQEQYTDDIIAKVKAKMIVPILDDIHNAHDIDGVLLNLDKYERAILSVDEIYSLNIANGAIRGNYQSLRIVPMSATKRNKIISKWIKVLEKSGEAVENDNFKQLDSLMRYVDATLGKALGKGVITAYPFFVLAILAMARSMQPASLSNITSQGYCYQALITIALANAGVEGVKTEMYFNYLEVLAYHFRNDSQISDEKLNEFNNSYIDKYNLSVSVDVVLRTLTRATIFYKHSSGYYSFAQSYLKYYFVAKYIAGHFKECAETYNELVQNLSYTANAYTVVFVSHHVKSGEQLTELKKLAESIYDGNVPPCFLRKEEMAVFDENYDKVFKTIMPAISQPPSSERKRELEIQDKKEEYDERSENGTEEATVFARKLTTAVRLAETVGQIIKSREGSMEKVELKALINLIVVLYSKITRTFLDSFIDHQDNIIKWIAGLINPKDKEKRYDILQKKASTIFWNLNYYALFNITTKCARAIGSESLYNVLLSVCEENNFPFYKLLQFYVDMWYNKRINVDEALTFNADKTIPVSVKWIFKRLISRFCATHNLDYKVRQQISIGMDIPYKIPVLDKDISLSD